MPTALEPDVFSRLQDAVKKIAARFPNPKRAQSNVARILEVSPSAVNRVLQEPGSGGSLRMVRKAAEYLNEPLEALLFGDAPRNQVRKLRDLPGFGEAMEEARRRVEIEHPGLAIEDLEGAADTRTVPEPTRVTGSLLIQIALVRRQPPPSGNTTSRRRRG